ncbi:MAG: chloramphenicol phosphotransferase [Pseudomonadota bacterium]
MSRIIFLHGASSAGKSTLAQAIRAESRDPWLHLSLDHFSESGAISARYFQRWPSQRAVFFDGMHRAFAGFADAGNDLIIEHILDTAGWHSALQKGLKGHDILFVGLRTALDLLKRREIKRGDRPIGSAARDYSLIHEGLRYDVELDGAASPEANAKRIMLAWQDSGEPSKFFGPTPHLKAR